MKRYALPLVALILVVIGALVYVFESPRRETPPQVAMPSAPEPSVPAEEPPAQELPPQNAEPAPAKPVAPPAPPPPKQSHTPSMPPPAEPRPDPLPQTAEPPPKIDQPRRVTSRALLGPEETEESGYGLYSYLVFGLRPTRRDSPRYQRCVKALEAYLELEDVSSVERYVSRNGINITYLPVKDPGARPDPAATLEVYDYSRAQRILSLTRGATWEGPFLISARRPLSDAQALPSENIFQDLSTVPPDLVRLWVKHFIAQAGQERFWERQTRDEFVLEMRTRIARGGAEIANLTTAFASLLWHFGPQP
jgi:hypothetical protein